MKFNLLVIVFITNLHFMVFSQDTEKKWSLRSRIWILEEKLGLHKFDGVEARLQKHPEELMKEIEKIDPDDPENACLILDMIDRLYPYYQSSAIQKHYQVDYFRMRTRTVIWHSGGWNSGKLTKEDILFEKRYLQLFGKQIIEKIKSNERFILQRFQDNF